MKISICITVFNEEKSIAELINSLIGQSKKANEIVIVDGGSNDKTVEILRKFEKRNSNIKLLVQKCNRAEGRNISVDLAKNEIIAMTDADCVADKDWLERITKPFKNKMVGIVAGFYKMKIDTDFRKAESVFLGITPSKFDINFLPSTRSIAFRKDIWEQIGGFPEGRNNSAEDTDFNHRAVRMGVKYSRVKNAIVEWSIPNKYSIFVKKIFNYAMWDASYGIWRHPIKELESHNIKVILKILRYLIGFVLVIFSIINPNYWFLLILLLIMYLIWSFRKVYIEFEDWRVGLWGVVLQITSDYAVISGFLVGIIKKYL